MSRPFALLFVISLLAGCATIHGMKRKAFVFYENEKKHKIILLIPKKISDEITLMDQAGNKEQQFIYSDSSLIYVTVFLKQVINSNKKTIQEGTDEKGRKWKQIQFENFEVGYRFVDPANLYKYEDAVTSIKIK